METCSVCLCTNRTLQPLGYLQDTFNIIIQKGHANLPEVALCFECFHVLKKCDAFKRRAELAQKIFLYHSQDGNLDSISNEAKNGQASFSSLTITNKNDFDYIFIEETREDVQTFSYNYLGTEPGRRWNYVILNNGLLIEDSSISQQVKEAVDLNYMSIDTNEIKDVSNGLVIEDNLTSQQAKEIDLNNVPIDINEMKEDVNNGLIIIQDASISQQVKEVDPNVICIDINDMEEECTQQLVNTDVNKVTNSLMKDSSKNKNTLKMRALKKQKVNSPFASYKLQVEQKNIEMEEDREKKSEQDKESLLSRKEFKMPKFRIVTKDDILDDKNTETPVLRTEHKNNAIRRKGQFGPLNKSINFTLARNAKDVPCRDEIYHQFSRVLTKPLSDHIEVKVMNDEELKIHRRSIRRDHQYVKSPYKCAKCIVGYATGRELNEHNKVKHMPGSVNTIKCPVCCCNVSLILYKLHYARHFVIYVCLRCDYATEEVQAARHHIQCFHYVPECSSTSVLRA